MDEPVALRPDLVAIAGRLLARAALRMRYDGEGGFHEEPGAPADGAEFIRIVQEWSERVLVDWLTESELTAIRSAPGELDDMAMIEASWALEHVGVLSWMMGFTEMPAYDEPFDFDDLAGPIYPGISLDELLENAELRSAQEVEAQARRCETVAWRLREIDSETEGARDYSRKLMGRAAILGDIRLMDGDLELRGVACVDQHDDVIDEVKGNAFERLHALNWLGGQEEEWDMVTCDTIVGWLWDQSWDGDHPRSTE